VLGTLRPRPIAQHAARLDLPAYAARVARRPAPSALVVGAGFAGATVPVAEQDPAAWRRIIAIRRSVRGLLLKSHLARI
jgi:NAD(P)-dependent dehydrogenase (short-subunit alcohol dehydrogenase family)